MAIISTKIGWLSLANLVVSLLIVMTVGIAVGSSGAHDGSWWVQLSSSLLVLLLAAFASLFLHTVMIVASFLGDGDNAITKTQFFLVNQVLLAIMMISSSIAALVFFENQVFILKKYYNSAIAASSFGIIGTLTHAVTAFIAKTT